MAGLRLAVCARKVFCAAKALPYPFFACFHQGRDPDPVSREALLSIWSEES